jgi:hypothetical protein
MNLTHKHTHKSPLRRNNTTTPQQTDGLHGVGACVRGWEGLGFVSWRSKPTTFRFPRRFPPLPVTSVFVGDQLTHTHTHTHTQTHTHTNTHTHKHTHILSQVLARVWDYFRRELQRAPDPIRGAAVAEDGAGGQRGSGLWVCEGGWWDKRGVYVW